MKKIKLLLLFLLSTYSYAQITYSKDEWGKTVAKDLNGKVIATYSEDAWGNTVKKDQNGNTQGTYTKNASGNTVYTPSNTTNNQINNNRRNNRELTVSSYKPITYNEIIQLQQVMNEEKNKHDYVLKVLKYYDEMWKEYKEISDEKLLEDFVSISKVRQTMFSDYNTNDNVNTSVNFAKQIFDNLSKAIDEFNSREIERKNKINAKKAQVKEYYNSLMPYLKNINDGWHNVMMLGNNDLYLCESRKVYVTNNTITVYLNGEGKSLNFNYGKIIDGKSMIETINENGEKNMLDIYFIEIL